MANGKCILIVEDDNAIRDILSLVLEVEGYLVVSAADGKDGLEKLQGVPRPCMVFLDLMMPMMDGWAFIEAQEKDSRVSSIPVVVVTAFSPEVQRVRAKSVLKKPIDLELLLKLARQYCG